MFAGTLTQTTVKKISTFAGTLRSKDFDIGITLVPSPKMSARSPDFAIQATNRNGRVVKIGSGWGTVSEATQNYYVSMQIDVGRGPFRVNAVQTDEQRKDGKGEFDIIPFVSNGSVNSGSMSGELTAMDADNAFAGHVASMMFDLDFMLIENGFKTEEKHPDYRVEINSPRGNPIRVGSAWMAQSERTGNHYISLLINTPDGDLRVNAVQNEDQRGGDTFSIIPFVDAANEAPAGRGQLDLVG
jgi:uncharacterized protein (DUF736 family)